MAMNIARRAQCSATKIAQYRRVIHSVETEIILIRRGMLLCFMKLVMYGPSFGWVSSQSYSLLFPRRNSAAASRSSGVVGSTGRKAPKIPSPNDIRPNMVRMIFTVAKISKLQI